MNEGPIRCVGCGTAFHGVYAHCPTCVDRIAHAAVLALLDALRPIRAHITGELDLGVWYGDTRRSHLLVTIGRGVCEDVDGIAQLTIS